MKREKKKFSLKNKMMAASVGMVFIPLLLTVVSFQVLRIYLFETAGLEFYVQGSANPRLSETFVADMFVAIILIFLFMIGIYILI